MQRSISIALVLVLICAAGCAGMRSRDDGRAAARRDRSGAASSTASLADLENRIFKGRKPEGYKFTKRNDCDHAEAHLPARDGGTVHILFGVDTVSQFTERNYDYAANRWRPVVIGDHPDIVISKGWVYIVGRNVSAGTRSHAIYAPGMGNDPPSKMLVDTTNQEGGNVTRTTPRLLHINDGGTNTAAQSWRCGENNSFPIAESFQRQGQSGGLSLATPIGPIDKVVGMADNACEDCGWDAQLQPYPDDQGGQDPTSMRDGTSRR